MKPQVVILGSGFAGHTAALHLSAGLRGKADVHVVSPGDRFTWFPGLIWVGTGTMSPESCQFALAPVYERIGVAYHDARAVEIHPESNAVIVRYENGYQEALDYDYCVNATGPYLNFEGTPGLGPRVGTTLSVCTIEHATQARNEYLEVVRALRNGSRRRLVIGIGHPAATCEGAAFEYLMNVDADLQ